MAVEVGGARTALAGATMGVFEGEAPAGPGDAYRLVLDGGPAWPDPCSRAQPQGLHGPSAVVDPGAFPWSDAAWPGLDPDDLVLYELHVGTFTPEGTFDAVVPRLRALRELGRHRVELMPVAQFPGRRNWGYDGVAPVRRTGAYGGPDGLRRSSTPPRARARRWCSTSSTTTSARGNYLATFGPYFTDRYRTPWGEALNFDGAGSDGGARVRRSTTRSCGSREYHVDGLRLDAVHAIFDPGAPPHSGASWPSAVRARPRGGRTLS